MVPVFKNVRERSTAKNYHPVSLLSVVNNVFEKLANNRLLDVVFFSDFQYGFSSRSTVMLWGGDCHYCTTSFDKA